MYLNNVSKDNRTASVFSRNSFWHLHNVAQCCAMLCNCGKLASCKPNQLCRDSDKLLHLNCSVISYDHYTVSALFIVHLYASQTQPESSSNFLFADVVVVIDDDNHYSSSASH